LLAACGVSSSGVLGGILVLVLSFLRLITLFIATETYTDRIVIGEVPVCVGRIEAHPSLRLQPIAAIEYVVNPATGYVGLVVEKGRAGA